jgi:hypothetical protein
MACDSIVNTSVRVKVPPVKKIGIGILVTGR